MMDAMCNPATSSESFARLDAHTASFITDRLIELARSELDPNSQHQVIDIGCGDGYLIARFACEFPNSFCRGIDPNSASINFAESRRLNNSTFEILSFSALREDERYDVALCSEVFEHVEDPVALVSKIFEVTKRGGLVLFSCPSGWMYRSPRISNLFRIAQDSRKFFGVYLNPLKNWNDALPTHPAVQPSVVRRIFIERGFEEVERRSSLWWVDPRGPLHGVFRRRGNRGLLWISLNSLSESIMNLIPPLRVFESRAVFAFKKP